ncbi:hypothetical protein SAMN04488528_106115, partial [Clostridium frigidicarnis]
MEKKRFARKFSEDQRVSFVKEVLESG